MEAPNYFTCTIGEAAAWNARPSTPVPVYNTVISFVDFLAEKYRDRWAVGSAFEPSTRARETNGDDSRDRQRGDWGEDREHKWRGELLSFQQLKKLSSSTAVWARDTIEARKNDPIDRGNEDAAVEEQGLTVAILASSSLVFLITWLGLIRAGFKVLSIEPHCSSDAIKHLLEASGAIALCHDSKHEKAVRDVLADKHFVQLDKRADTSTNECSTTIQAIQIPWSTIVEIKDLSSQYDASISLDKPHSPGQNDQVVYYRHSSGTYSGLPKLIPYTHYSAISVLPRLQHVYATGAQIVGTLSTTPLYHGGLADLWRCWSAASPLWIFPEDKAPIFGKTVLAWTQAIEKVCEDARVNSVYRGGYVSCVPYVLQMMIDETKMRDGLKRMDMVGVGGAEMPAKLGDELVAEGINLVSRFGNAECGFLLSSNRSYENDKEWQYLRLSSDVDSIYLKKHGALNFELVVTEKWPLLSSAIVDKLPFHTSDLFLPHPNIKNAWKYIGRSDSQLTLVTGKKFNPSSIEAELRESNMIQDAVVVGEGRSYPASLVFLSSNAEDQSPKDPESHIWSLVQQINLKGASHAQLKRNMIRIFGHEDSNRLKKSSKGTIKRSSVPDTFREEIEELYSSSTIHAASDPLEGRDLEDVPDAVKAIVEHVLQRQEIAIEAMLFDEGCDSVACVAIRNHLQRLLQSQPSSRLPLNVVYECGSIKSLADFIIQKRNGHVKGTEVNDPSQDDRGMEMEDMVNKYVSLQPVLLRQALTELGNNDHQEAFTRSKHGNVVLLTGGTGFLGVHILDQLLKARSVTKIILLVRIPSPTSSDLYETQAGRRISSALEAHHLQPLDHPARLTGTDTIVSYLRSSLDSPSLGLAPSNLHELLSSVTSIIHAAWPVNFNLPLQAFSAQMQAITNLHNIAHLARQSRPREDIKLTFCSSVASVGGVEVKRGEEVEEEISYSPGDAGELGYSRSKWVAERLIATLAANHPNHCQTSIVRIGQLCGDTEHGIWNMREAWPLMLDVSLRIVPSLESATATSVQQSAGILPDLHRAGVGPLAWVPVDVAAKAVVEIGLKASRPRAAEGVPTAASFYHVVSNASGPTWADVQAQLQNSRHDQEPFVGLKTVVQVVPAQDWLNKLEALDIKHPAKNLLSLWRKNWQGNSPSNSTQRKVYSTSRAEGASEAMKDKVGRGISMEEVERMVAWVLSERSGNE